MKKISGFFVAICLTAALFCTVSFAALPVKVTTADATGDLSALDVPGG